MCLLFFSVWMLLIIHIKVKTENQPHRLIIWNVSKNEDTNLNILLSVLLSCFDDGVVHFGRKLWWHCDVCQVYRSVVANNH